MQNKRRNRVLAGLFLLSFLIIFTSGCDKYTRHEVLTFFFTGVPHPDEEKEVPGVLAGKIKGKPIPEAEYFVHGPSAAKQCYHCHMMSSGFGFRNTGRKETGRIPMLGLGVGRQTSGMFVAPLKDLCTECHIQKSDKSANGEDLWLHGPVASGNCTTCHSPHKSRFQYMLLKEKSIELCGQCHPKGQIREIEEHTKDKECSACHNPHRGKDRLLLKKDFNEVF